LKKENRILAEESDRVTIKMIPAPPIPPVDFSVIVSGACA
jgi:hypothetical protein